MIYEVHYTLRHEGQISRLPEGVKTSVFTNFSLDGKPLFRDALITSQVEANSLMEAAKQTFSAIRFF